MATKVIMPKQGLQMTEGTIIHWLVAEGEPVRNGQPLFEMETDKLSITIDAAVDGTLLKIVRGAGETVPITELIGIIGDVGEDFSAFLDASAAPVRAETSVPAVAAPSRSSASAPVVGGADGRLFASPRAKMRAAELEVDIAGLTGSAPDGMVIERDVVQAAGAVPKASPLARKTARQAGMPLAAIQGSGPHGKIKRADVLTQRIQAQGERDVRPLSGMRRSISRRMKESQDQNAQTTHRVRVRMTEATRCRESLKEAGHKISFNDLVAMSVARALLDHPKMNVELVDDGIWYKDFVNMGIAVALDDGLVVPVVRDADCMSLLQLSAAIRDAAAKARDGVLGPDEYTGGSFTISNLGMFGLDEFTAIINPPESGILAVGKIQPAPVAIGDKVEVHPVMALTLSYDHRVVDGAPAAQFLCGVKDYLENPYRLL